MQLYLSVFQIIISAVLIVLILLQQRGSDMGSAFGGGNSGFYSTRRGIEQKIFWATVICGILFVVLAITHLLI